MFKVCREYLMFLIILVSFLYGLYSLSTVHIIPQTEFGISLEKVLPLGYWIGLSSVLITMFCMIQLIGQEKKMTNAIFLISSMLLIVYMRGVLSIIVPLPYPLDAWARMSPLKHWLKQGYVDLSGHGYTDAEYAHNWPLAYLLSYLFVSIGVDLYTFFRFAPMFIHALNVFLVYVLMKEIAGEKIGLLSSFFFALLNTNSFFPLHWCPQLLGSSLFLLSTYISVRMRKTKSRKLVVVVLSILSFLLVITHHISTLYFISSTAGIWLGSKIVKSVRLPLIKVNRGSQLLMSTIFPPLFTLALWYTYGFFVYPVHQTNMMQNFIQVAFYGMKLYETGNLYYFTIQSPFEKVTLLAYPVFILGSGMLNILNMIWKERRIEGYMVSMLGWTASMAFLFILGNALTMGMFFEPARARELISISFYPFSTMFFNNLNSQRERSVALCLLLIVAILTIFKVYLGASSWGIISEPPAWW